LSMPPIELGRRLFTERGCSQCHRAEGKGGAVGPAFEQTYGNSHEFADGTSVTADENYIRESIENPQAKVRRGSPPTMPTYKGLLRREESRGLVAFIKPQNPRFKEEAERQCGKPLPQEGEDAGEAAAPPDGGAQQGDQPPAEQGSST